MHPPKPARADLDIEYAGHPEQSSAQTRLIYRYPPFFITFVSMFQLFVFVYYALRLEAPISMIGPVPFKSTLIYNPYKRYEFWRYLTYAFVHAGWWHLTFNLIIQLGIGVPLEIVHKFNPIFIIYFGGVVGGALGNSITDPHSYLAGASGGCYALIAGHLANVIINWKEMKNSCFRLTVLLIFTSLDASIAIFERYSQYRNRQNRTSYGAHFSGFVSGLLLGLIFLRNVRILKWESTVARIACVIYVSLVTFAIAFNIIYPDYFPPSDPRDSAWAQSPFSVDREGVF